jgi:hypothetical protein
MRSVAVGRNAFLFDLYGPSVQDSLVESCKADEVNPLTHLTYVLTNGRNGSVPLPRPNEFAALSTALAGGCAF